MRRYAKFMQNRCGKWYPTAKRTGLHGEEKKFLSNYGQAYGAIWGRQPFFFCQS